MRFGYVTAVAACLLGCSSTPAEDPAEPQPLIGAEYEHELGTFELAPGYEDAGLCASWTLNNDELLYVNAVEIVTSAGGFHHSNWFYVPEAHLDGADGVWRCDERAFNEAVAATLGGVLFAQSTQSVAEIQQFEEGVVLPVPPRSRVVGNIHVLNTGGAPLTTTMTMGLHTIEESEVTTKLAAMSLSNEALAIPPAIRSEFAIECAINEKHREHLGRDADFNIYWVLPHYHTLGVGMRLEAFGEQGTEVIIDVEDGVGDPLGQQLTPAFSMAGFDGLRFSCRYDNPEARTVGYGVGDQEMCVMLAFTDSPLLWGGGSFDGAPGEPQMEGDMARFRSGCGVLAYPAAHAR